MAVPLSAEAVRPLDRWNNNYFQPGAVGSIGGCLISERLKHNMPDAPLRWAEGSVGRASILKGTNLQDGMKLNLSSRGGPAVLIDSHWGGRQSTRTKTGWEFTDVRLPDKLVIPLYGDTPGYSWNNKVARTFKMNVVGKNFLPLPGGYSPAQGSILRGGNYPRISSQTGFNEPAETGVPAENVPVGQLRNPQTMATQFNYAGEKIDRAFRDKPFGRGLGIK